MKKPAILCVDDEKDILDSLFDLLLDSFSDNFEIELAESGAEALEIAAEYEEMGITIPLILADFIMPGMKGDELLITLNRNYPEMIKILLTGQATLGGVKNSYENANLYRYIAKPWEPQDLILTVREALKSYYKSKKLKRVENNYKRIFENAAVGIVQTLRDGTLLVINPAFAALMGYSSPDEAFSSIDNIHSIYADANDVDYIHHCLSGRTSFFEIETRLIKQDDSYLWVHICASPLLDENGEIDKIELVILDISKRKKAELKLELYHQNLERTVETRTAELNQALVKAESLNRNLKEANSEITENINYARRIQVSILPENNLIANYINDFFILWKPKHIVGGDFYWFKKTAGGFLIALADCTGHGVSGAFGTLIAYSELNRVVEDANHNDPSLILNELHHGIIKTLNKRSRKTFADDGLDMSLCYYNAEDKTLTFAGANISLFYYDDSKIITIRGDKQSIGYMQSKAKFKVTNHTITLPEKGIFYLVSDGYIYQPGGEKNNPFGYRRFSDLIASIYNLPMDKQKELVLAKFNDYIGLKHAQVDDVTVIAFRLPA